MTKASSDLSLQPGGPAPRRFILHITSGESWRAGKTKPGEEGGGAYRDPSLETEGFIHCSTVDQFLIPANERFAGRRDLVLLVIDTERLDHKPVYEDCYESGNRFPHIYGPVPLAAIVETIGFPPDDNGRFHEPVELRPLLNALGDGPCDVDGTT